MNRDDVMRMLSDENERLRKIVAAVAQSDPTFENPERLWRPIECALCDGECEYDDGRMLKWVNHDDDCPWLLAREAAEST